MKNSPGTNYFATLNDDIDIALTSDKFSVGGTLLAVYACCAGNPNAVALQADTYAVGCSMLRTDVISGANVYYMTGTTASPAWTLAGSGGGSGTVTLVTAGTGLQTSPGAGISTTGSVFLADTSVIPGSYTTPNITVDQQGRITSASNGVGGGVTSVSNSDGTLTISPTTGAVVASIALTKSNIWTPTAGTFFNQNGIAVTPTDSVILQNTTASTLAVPVQISPALEFKGHMWQSGAGGSDHTGTFRMYQIPVNGASAGVTTPGILQWDSSKDGSYTTNIMNLGRFGTLTTAQGITATTGSLTVSSGGVNASGQVVAGTNLVTGTNGGQPGKIFFQGSTSGSVTIAAPAVVSNYDMFWPGAQGTGALTNDGSGNLSWSTTGGTVSTDATLTGNGSGGSPLGLNLSNSNSWIGTQDFGTGTVSIGSFGLKLISGGQFIDIQSPASITTYTRKFAGVQGSANSYEQNDGSGNLSWYINKSGSFSGTGTATTVFTVAIGQTMPSTTYKVNVTPTATLAAAVFYVTNKTTTTFDVTYLAGLTGTITFDWSVFQ